MQASGSLVELDIMELPRFPCLVVGICHTSIGLVKKLDQKLPLGKKPSLRLMMNHGEGISGSNLGQIQSHPHSEFLFESATATVRHTLDVKHRPKNIH